MSSERDEDITLEDLLERFRDAASDEIETSGPGRVESYDPATQTADIVPMVRRTVPRADGTSASETRATLRSVRIVQPRAGGFFVHLPVAAGDFVLLVIGDRDPARWRVTGEVSDPIDRRTHHIAHAVAVPGYYPRTRNLDVSLTPADALVIGSESGDPPARLVLRSNGDVEIGWGATDLVSLATLVDARIAAIVNAFDTHTHAVPAGPGTSAVPAPLLGDQLSTASVRTRAA